MKVAAVAYVLQKAMEGVTKAWHLWGDETISTEKKVIKSIDAIMSKIPLLGGIYEAARDLTSEIDHGQASNKFHKERAQSAGYQSYMAASDPLRERSHNAERETNIAKWTRQSYGDSGLDPWLINKRLHDAAKGEGFTDLQMKDQNVRQALQAKIDARRGLGVAKQTTAYDQAYAEKAQANYTDARDTYVNSPEINKDSGLNNMMKQLDKIAEVTRTQVLAEKAVLQAKQSQVDLAQKQAEFDKASLDVTRAKYALTAQQLDQAKGSAQGWGMMSGGDKLAVHYAMQQAKEQGWDSLTEDQRGLVSRTGVTQEWAAKQARASVANDPLYAETAHAAGGKTVTELESQLKDLGGKIEVQIEVDKVKLAVAMKEAAESWFGEVKRMMDEQIGVEGNKVKVGIIATKAIEDAGGNP